VGKLLTLQDDAQLNGEGGGLAGGVDDLVAAVCGSSLRVAVGGEAVASSSIAAGDLDSWGGNGQGSEAKDDGGELHVDGCMR
jgi:hypothetical protein